ncbi:class I SAM-dependent methyltransferase [Pseudonocardia sp. HH130630-07]|uniref:class I SAM-dependent methyltransferase n=1 Tax=Pseudonocardia sp. HH130630-07 TaxID=1690815 RepID=UPI000814D039|nr:class I SAM-dependent methyltransferase [Pseudonocardia sp. HH130630-07]ANY07723.1 hypothetical protein AFB00_17090 [Pseudonocardia sp. HH130630-07]
MTTDLTAWRAEDYAQVNSNQVTSALAALDLVEDTLPTTGGRLADVGCGTGEVARTLAGRGIHVDASDASRSMVDATAHACRGLDVTVSHQDADHHVLEPGAYDVVHCSWVLHWLTDLDHAVTTMAAAVRPGGALVLQWSHSRPDAPGGDVIDAFREVAARDHWRGRLTAAPLRNRQHPISRVRRIVEGAGLVPTVVDTDLWPAPAGPPDLGLVHRKLRCTGFAEQAEVLGADVDAFIDEGLRHAVATGRTDPGDARLVARRPGARDTLTP